MKRTPLKFEIPTCYTLIFWRKCCKCNDEFRREKGGVFTYGLVYYRYQPTYYVCQSCLSDFNSSEQDMKTFFFGDRPSPPPSQR